MRKLIVLVLLAGVLLAALPVTATPTAELTALAQYYPADTPVFFAMRTDAGYFETLDALQGRIQAVLPAGTPLGTRLSTGLDMLAQHIDPAGDFQSVFRSWLGDTVTFGLLSLEPSENSFDDPAIAVVFSITDQAAAENAIDQFFSRVAPDAEVNEEQLESGTLYEAASRNVAFLLTDGALVLGNDADALARAMSTEARLNSSEDFNASLAALPMDEYDMALYIDSQAFTSAMSEAAEDEDEAFSGMMSAFMNIASSQAWGFALVDNNSLVLDIATSTGDLSGLESLGFTMPPAGTPIDPAFAAHVPADAPLVFQGTDLATTYNYFIENFRAMAELQAAAGDEDAENFQQQINFVQATIGGLTGLDFQEEILGWMTGDYALFLNFNLAALENLGEDFPLDFGFVVEATDAAAAQAVVEGLVRALEQMQPENVTLTREDISGVNVAVIENTEADNEGPSELVIGANDEVFVVGTRNAVADVFQPADSGLAADPAFVAAQNYYLDNASSVLYFNPQALMPLAEMMSSDMEVFAMRNGSRVLQALADLANNASITSMMSEDGATARFVLTLAV
jgi:hypothetical protein